MQASPDRPVARRNNNDEDDDGDVNMLVSPDDATVPNKTCFTQLPSRRFWVPLLPTACQLCPSMDLLVLGLSNQSLVLHRTVTAQKLATISGGFSAEDDDKNDKQKQEKQAAELFACFRPDGRFLAVASSTQLALYAVEELLSNNHPGSMTDSAATTNSCLTVPLDIRKSTITGLFWVHVGNPHPAWEVPSEEEHVAAYWKYAKRFCDQSTILLPPSDYHHSNPQHAPDHGGHGEGSSATLARVHSILPASDTPLNLLCVTTEQELQLYLHGRFPILKAAIGTTGGRGNTVVDMAVSNNLTHFLLYPRGSHVLTIHSLPEMTRQRYTLQRIGTLSCSLQEHVQAIQTNVQDVAAAWKSSLKPLDLKLDLLTNLLQKYGLQGLTTSYFVQYILSGHTRAAPSLAHVMDQYFTNIQMNDQLLQRMEQSLSGAVQNVETQFRKSLWSPAQALLFQANEIVALAMTTTVHKSNTMLSVELAKQVQEWSARLYMVVEMAMTELVDARFRLRDFVAWLRSVGSQIKANGTALNSVQRQNAKKRRVPDVVVERMLKYLQTEQVQAHGVTEVVLGLRFSSLLNDTDDLQSISVSPIEHDTTSIKHCDTVPELITQVSSNLVQLLKCPRNFMAQSIFTTSLVLQSGDDRPVVAVTTRLGMGGVNPTDVPFGEEEHNGFFAPVDDASDSATMSSNTYKEWCIIAEAIGNVVDGPKDTIQLNCLPLTWTGTEEKDGDDHHGFAANVFWAAHFCLPEGCNIVEVKFYGDDGKSSLTSGEDGGIGKERRQSVGFRVERLSEEGICEEFWLLSYDQSQFRRMSTRILSDRHFGINTDLTRSSKIYRYMVLPVPESFDEEEDVAPHGTVFAKTRVLSTGARGEKDATAYSQLMLSGSRGVGAILSGPTSVDLFDLEEDEEAEGDDEDVSV